MTGKSQVWSSFTLNLKCLKNCILILNVNQYSHHNFCVGKHQLIGSFTTTVDRIQAYKENKPYELINEKRKKKKGKKYINSGTIHFEHIEIERCYSLLEYIQGGLQIGLNTAVDFTASNGDPRLQNSLHYISDKSLNLYQCALKSVGQIVIDYDTDKIVPCYGFGAKLPGQNVANVSSLIAKS